MQPSLMIEMMHCNYNKTILQRNKLFLCELLASKKAHCISRRKLAGT